MAGKKDADFIGNLGIVSETGLATLSSCLESIRKYHPDAPIYVIDSASSDQSYHLHVEEKYNVTVDYAQNKNYPAGTVRHAYMNYPEIEYFYFLQDSHVVHDNLEDCLSFDLTTISWWDCHKGVARNRSGRGFGFRDQENIDLCAKWLEEHTSYTLPDLFTGCWGSLMFCKRHVLETLEGVGYFNILPTNKREDQMMERLTGVVLESAGFNLKEHSLRNTGRLTKKFCGRK